MDIERTSVAAWILVVALFTLGACGGSGGGSGQCDACDTPPGNACDGDTLYTFTPIGECADGQCIYPPTVTDCPAGCEDGACLEVIDPCEGVACDDVPADSCDGDTAVQYADGGVCDPATGGCEYTPRRTNCARNGLICVDGACQPIDPCEDVQCDEPPAATCLNPGTVQTWSESGTCEADGTCTYEPTNVSCTDDGLICIDGACVDEPPCFGDDCDVVADPYCTGTVSVRAINGRCDEDESVCVSDEERIDCALTGKICEDGICVSDVACRGVVCDVPPESRCEGSRLVRYADEGYCVAGEGTCTYTREVIACSDMDMTCQDGECVDASCLGVICAAAPDDVCDGDTLLTYAPRGTCDGGDCTYAPTEIDCTATDQRCDRGACVDPLPCEDVVCGDAPEPYCVDDVLRVPSGGGVCEDGVCRYGESIVDCGAAGQTCREGGCRDACFGVTCEEPPAGACDEDTAIGFEPVGVCRPSTGECEYTTTTANCITRGEVCIDGECVTDPCDDEVTCDEPPAGTCEDNVAVIPFGAGICSRGTCAFAERRRDCTPEDLTCIDGDCRDACYGVTCDAPPVDWCDGDTRIHYPEDGTCNPETGGCRYRAESENCASDGLICLDGACVADPCDTGELTCDTLPDPTCDGEVEVVAYGDGLCERGACSFAERRTDCAVDGLSCIDGGCRDACYSVTCDEPPSPTCDGELLLTWADDGTCDPDDGSCSYRQTALNCASDGQLCIDGACVDDPCDEITCDDPPAGVCEDDLLVEGFGTGTCSRGECTYSFIRRDCAADGLSCADGDCRDACYGVTCEEPPAAACDGEILTTWSDSGTCLPLADGDCLYEPTTTNCSDTGQLCVDGACVDDPCDLVTCESPADPVCEGNVLYAEFGVGVCDRGECSYSTRVRDCDDDGLTCIDGDCRDDCYEVVCDAPPAPTCAEDVLVSYEDIGTCDPSDASCSYTLVTTNCVLDDQLCIDGACVDDPCDTVTCDAPPDSYCDENTEVEPFGAGLCDRGDCSYAERRLDCDSVGQTCIDGACRDACYGVTCDSPPGATCEGDTSLGFLDAGTCDPSTGECSYTAVTENCLDTDELCIGGECVPDPCLDLTCDTPPDSYCDANTEVVPFGVGECDRGDCSYAERRTPCEEIDQTCLDGACRDACYEVVCDEVPDSYCLDQTAFEFAADSGICRLPGGACEYVPEITNCLLDGGVCFEGSCILDPCSEGDCDTPPDSTCDGDSVVAYLPGGVCTLPDGACEFDEVRTDCTESGLVCRTGECVDACDGVTCDAPPEPTCTGVLLAEFALPGECNPIDGSCSYFAETTDCSATGQLCVDGACVDDPCEGVTCDAPPSPVCDADDLVTSLEGGVCNSETGLCEYPELRVDCIEVGSVACVDGACVDRCDVVVCDDPPATDCLEDLVRTYTSPGTCDPAEGCQYGFDITDCAATGEVCRDGACAPPDACDLITCDASLGQLCEGNTVVSYAEVGTCTDGECSYPSTRTDCGDTDQFCLLGECVDEDPCEGLTCDTPPSGTCDGLELTSYVFSGTCSFGICIWDEVVTTCAEGEFCLVNSCVDLCDSVTCDEPPESFCGDNRTYVEYVTPGVCEAGACTYTEVETDCSATGGFCSALDGCVAEDLCIGVTCEPLEIDPVCEGTVILEPVEPVCIGGSCTIVDPLTDCADTGQLCVDAECVDDPCLDVFCIGTPEPERDCADDFTTRVYTFTGECADGACLTETTNTDCSAEVDFGICVDGFCASGAPCFDGCDEDILTCDGTELVTQGSGRCYDGACRYEESREDCAAVEFGICRDGACLTGSPCEELDCTTPPDPACFGNTAFVSTGPGTCEEGFCRFDTTETDCGATEQFCVDGECVDDDPCDSLLCDDFPPNSCLGTFAIQYLPPSDCVDGACVYPSTVTDCSSTGLECFEGECVDDPCDGVVCDTPPGATCDGDALVFYDELGTCSLGVCTYGTTTGECTAPDVCVDGACAPEIYRAAAQDVVISEYLAAEAGWFELHNTTAASLDLFGLGIDFGGDAPFVLATSVVVGAGDYALFAVSTSPGIFDADVELPPDGDLTILADGPFRLLVGERVIDEITIDATWPGDANTAAQRDVDALGTPSTVADWCDATSEYFPGYFGTPGGANFACAP